MAGSNVTIKIKQIPLRIPEGDYRRLERCGTILRTPVNKIIVQGIMLYLRELELKLNIQEGETE